jgi:N-glycosidase YbiA
MHNQATAPQRRRPLAGRPRPGLIDRFAGELALRSNLHRCEGALVGVTYPPVDDALAPAKTDDASGRERIRRAPTPRQARRLGRLATLRGDWERDRLQALRVRRRFARDRRLHERPLASGGRVENNDWGDRRSGACSEEGENRLGPTLMEVRPCLAGGRAREQT